MQLAHAHSPSIVAASPGVNGGGSFTAGRRRPPNGRGDSPPCSGGSAAQSAFYSQAQELGKDSSPVSLTCPLSPKGSFP